MLARSLARSLADCLTWPNALAVLAVAAACSGPPPLSEEEAELVQYFGDMLDCVAANNGSVTNLPMSGTLSAYRGEVDPVDAVECLISLNERGRIHAFDEGETNIRYRCDNPLALGCVRPDYRGCNKDRLFIQRSTMPPALIDEGPLGSPSFPMGRRQTLGFGQVLYHEAIHTVQSDRFRNCVAGYEIEAYEHESRYASWLGSAVDGQVYTMVDIPIRDFSGPGGQHPVCRTLGQAIALGMSPCIVEWIQAAFPDVGLDDELSPAQCRGVARLAFSFHPQSDSGGLFLTQFRHQHARCAVSSVAEPLVASSGQHLVKTIADANGVVYQYWVDEDGETTLAHSFATPLDEIQALSFASDVAGVAHLLVAGVVGTEVRLVVVEDSLGGEFATPPDGIFDGTQAVYNDVRLRHATQIVDGGASPSLIWDAHSQIGVQLTRNANGVVNGFAGSVALRVPVELDGARVWHDPTEPELYVSPDRAGAVDMTTYRFPLFQGVYVFDGEYVDFTEREALPPGFLDAPEIGTTSIHFDAPPGHTVVLHQVDTDGNSLGTLGSAVSGSAGVGAIGISPLSAAFVRLKDLDNGQDSQAIPAVQSNRVRVRSMAPTWVGVSGGDRVFVRGQNLGAISDVRVGGISVPFTIHDSSALTLTTPSLAEDVHPVELISTGVTYRAGTLSTTSAYVNYFDGTRLATEWFAGGSGWTCGTSALAANAPDDEDAAGCRFQTTEDWGFLLATQVQVPQQWALDLVVHHQGEFGNDGDGVVWFAWGMNEGDKVFVLTPAARPAARVHATSCVGVGAGRTCSVDPPSAGQRGFAKAAVPRVWRNDVFHLPGELVGAGTIAILAVAQNMSPVAAANYAVSSVSIRQRDAWLNPAVHSESDWTQASMMSGSCAGVLLGGGFGCAIDASIGRTLRYFNAPNSNSTGYAYIPLPLDALGGRQVRARVSHMVNFTSGNAVGTGAGRFRLWCSGTEWMVSPVDGFPLTPPGVAPGFTDEGPEHAVWAEDVIDLTGFAGLPGCWLDLLGSGQVSASGWEIASVIVEWR